MKNNSAVITGILFAALSLFTAGCFTEDGTEENSGTPTISVWEVKRLERKCIDGDRCSIGEIKTVDTPKVYTNSDIDSDGVTEFRTDRTYFSIYDGLLDIYIRHIISDGGSVTSFKERLAEDGIINGTFHCDCNTVLYTVNGNIYTDGNGNEMKIVTDGDTMTITKTEEGVLTVFTLTKAEIPYPEENCEAFGLEPSESYLKNNPATEISAYNNPVVIY